MIFQWFILVCFVGIEKVFDVLNSDADNEYAMIDSTIVRAHQHTAGVKRGIKRSKLLVVAKGV